ncbi:MAG TPA: geranylgeranylglycerol-phosphate geranylgeranyltransferase [Flavobacteriaceae bacterium]|nr:geranylgeranylglycerol-phosphate geranylgeranyltransferase [Flavobacteriaceae bacterium]
MPRIRHILNLIRWKNLLMIALAQVLIKYALLVPFGVPTALDWSGFSLLVLSTLCIAAAGNVINDIYDVETDSVNKPDKVIVGKTLSEKTANNLFIILNVIGVAIGFYLSHLVDRTGFFAIFVIISALLYVYASYLKQMLLIGNLVISVLVGLSILIVGLFDLLPVLTALNLETQLVFFKTILDYAIFAFLINLVRELAKDLEDIDGDYKAGMNTLPIVIGRERATKVLFVISLIPLFAVVYYMVMSLYKEEIAIGYFLLFIVGPLIYVAIKSLNAKTKKEFHHIGNVLKLVMFFGILSLLLYKYLLIK